MKKVVSILTIFCSTLAYQTIVAQTSEKNVTVIELTQTEGQFDTQVLNLTTGLYQFRIVNENVDRDLGFVIQYEEDKGDDVMVSGIPNSFTTAHVKKDQIQYTGIVDLKKGRYVYSCPLNPTPHYTLIVK